MTLDEAILPVTKRQSECRGTRHDRGPGSAGDDGRIQAIAEFFHTGLPPVDVAQAIEEFELMTAAPVSKERNGAEVSRVRHVDSEGQRE